MTSSVGGTTSHVVISWKQIGFGRGSDLALRRGFLSVARDASAQACAPPGPPGTAKAWRRDNRPIRQRKAASTLSSAEVQKLRDAYKAMRDLSASDPERSARLHAPGERPLLELRRHRLDDPGHGAGSSSRGTARTSTSTSGSWAS
jgi:hypothetical protein